MRAQPRMAAHQERKNAGRIAMYPTITMLTEREVRTEERARALNEAADMIADLPCGHLHEMDVLLGLARDMIAKAVRDMARG
jgi:hypothetical protein